LSTANIVDIQLSGLSVLVTFKVHGAEGTRTYQYFDLEAVRGIMNGEDPSQWSGVQVSGGGGGSAVDTGAIGEIGEDIAEIGTIAEL
jgi:hypothetical protein